MPCTRCFALGLSIMPIQPTIRPSDSTSVASSDISTSPSAFRGPTSDLRSHLCLSEGLALGPDAAECFQSEEDAGQDSGKGRHECYKTTIRHPSKRSTSVFRIPSRIPSIPTHLSTSKCCSHSSQPSARRYAFGQLPLWLSQSLELHQSANLALCGHTSSSRGTLN
jgi:hypothetical protein